MVNEHGVAGEEQLVREHDASVGGSGDARTCRKRIVRAVVNLRRVDLAVEDVTRAESLRGRQGRRWRSQRQRELRGSIRPLPETRHLGLVLSVPAKIRGRRCRLRDIAEGDRLIRKRPSDNRDLGPRHATRAVAAHRGDSGRLKQIDRVVAGFLDGEPRASCHPTSRRAGHGPAQNRSWLSLCASPPVWPFTRAGGAGRGSTAGRACPRRLAAITAALTSPAMPNDSTAVRVVVSMCSSYARCRPQRSRRAARA